MVLRVTDNQFGLFAFAELLAVVGHDFLHLVGRETELLAAPKG